MGLCHIEQHVAWVPNIYTERFAATSAPQDSEHGACGIISKQGTYSLSRLPSQHTVRDPSNTIDQPMESLLSHAYLARHITRPAVSLRSPSLIPGPG